MKRLAILVLLAMIAVTTWGQDTITPDPYAIKNDLLEDHLSFLNKKAFGNRMLGGGVYTGLGALSILGGAMMPESWLDQPDGTSQIMQYTLYAMGGVFIVGGIIQFIFPAPAEKSYREFIGLSSIDMTKRVARGDRIFKELAAKCKTDRLIAGGIGIAFGVGSILFFDQTETSLYTSAFECGMGLALILVPSREERELEYYLAE